MMKLPALGTGELKPDALKARLDKAAAAWIATIDPKNGGFGTAPKLPEPELIRFLLTRDKAAQDAALNAARALVAGAAHDRLDGGFYRRCIDEEWKEPYFQKTLSDQARIALALFAAADVAKDDKLRAAGIGALDFALKELRNTDGTFAAALDGTLEENSDPAKRPKFVKVGSASTGAVGLLITALMHSGDQRYKNMMNEISGKLPISGKTALGFGHSVTSESPGTATDFLSMVLVARKLNAPDLFKLFETINERYFDSSAGVYLALPMKLPMGIAMRAPASGETPSAEVLALLAGVDQKTADLIRRNLFAAIEYDDLPPGDVLLGLSQK